MALKCRGMGKAMKRSYKDGGKVEGPNEAQRATGANIFSDTRNRREAEAGLMDAVPLAPRRTAPAPAMAPVVAREAKAPPRRSKAEQDAQFIALEKKRRAEMLAEKD